MLLDLNIFAGTFHKHYPFNVLDNIGNLSNEDGNVNEDGPENSHF